MSWFTWFQNLWRPKSPRQVEPSSRPDAGYAVGPSDALNLEDARIRVGVVSVVGNYREHNEDNYFVPGLGTLDAPDTNGPPLRPTQGSQESPTGQLTAVATSATKPIGPFIVADGMGGQLAGEQASKLAVELIPRELFPRLTPSDDARATQLAIRSAVAAANKEIIAQAHVMPEFSNMGTTVALLLFRKDRAFIAGVGDSRVYRLRNGTLEKLTKDHDLASALVDAGTIKAHEVEHHRFRNVLYLYLGSPEAREGPEEVRVLDVRLGDIFLLASDGLTGVVRDEHLTEILHHFDDPQEAARAMVDRALANDSRDNITCVVIHIT